MALLNTSAPRARDRDESPVALAARSESPAPLKCREGAWAGIENLTGIEINPRHLTFVVSTSAPQKYRYLFSARAPILAFSLANSVPVELFREAHAFGG
ncbi:hypothetical protein EVAR_22979_1 [Eumeta japonica]|uniref:Uncharacterized protein n=1 Tax=Eumeta variegata TaxID=151549 RepID=A0A4C1URB1_EUMVA|nr:hypothetical protein EVAR_22979_1 [Eumeta japonica]